MTPENEAALPSHVHAALANAGILAHCSHGRRDPKHPDDFDVFMTSGFGIMRDQLVRLMEDCPEFTCVDPDGYALRLTFDYKKAAD